MPAPAPAVAAARPGPIVLDGDEPEPLRGAAARTVQNMEASLGVPTATSVRAMPAKLLEVNRQILNNQLARTGAGKVSFTHLIAFAVLRALADFPGLNSSFAEEDGKPVVVRHHHVNLGLAVDVQRRDGAHTLLVPCVKEADTLDFAGFWQAYEALIEKVHGGTMSPDDFAGTTCTITNPGMIGTVHSVPRLMPGQGFIIGVGAIGYPAEYEGADPATLAQLGVSKVTTLTNTYDHRIITGAESGEFLRRIHDLLLGNDGFYDGVFASLAVPYKPARWNPDRSAFADPASQNEKVVQVHSLINMYRVRGHLIANLDPLGRREPRTHPELDITQYDLSIWDLDREFPVGDLGAGRLPSVMPLPRHPRCAARRVLAHRRRRVHAHPGARPEGLDPGAGRGRAARRHPRREAPDPRAAQRRRGVRAFPAHQVPRTETVQPRGRGDARPDARRAVQRSRRLRDDRRRLRHDASRPPQHAGERGRQVVRADLPRVRR